MLTIASSLLAAVAFVTGNSNLAFASKKKSDGGGSDKGDGSSGGGGSGKGSTDNTGGGGETTGGSDNSNGGDTSNTSPPTSTEQTTPSAPPASNQQTTTCPDGSTPDASGNCPAATTSPSSGGGQVPPECQDIIAGPTDKCSLGTTGSPISPSNLPQLTPQQQYEECLKGIGGGIPGNCKPPPATTTEQKLSPQTLIQQTCQDGSTPDASGMCKDGSTPQQVCSGGEVLDAKGDCVSSGEAQAIKNGTIIPIGDGRFRLPTVPPVPNTNTIAPICPIGSHLELNKCVLNGALCPSGTDQDGDLCRPQQNPGPCGRPDYVKFHGICYQGKETVPNPDGSCPPTTPNSFEGRCFDKLPVLPGSKTGSGGGFIQMIPVKPPPASSPTNTPPVQP